MMLRCCCLVTTDAWGWSQKRKEGWGVNHRWHRGVVSHSYGGLGGGRDEVAVGGHGRQSQERLIARREMPEHFPNARRGHRLHPIIPPSRYAALGRIESELVGLPGMALTWEATRRLRFVVHVAGWLHSMVLDERLRCCCCITKRKLQRQNCLSTSHEWTQEWAPCPESVTSFGKSRHATNVYQQTESGSFI